MVKDFLDSKEEGWEVPYSGETMRQAVADISPNSVKVIVGRKNASTTKYGTYLINLDLFEKRTKVSK